MHQAAHGLEVLYCYCRIRTASNEAKRTSEVKRVIPYVNLLGQFLVGPRFLNHSFSFNTPCTDVTPRVNAVWRRSLDVTLPRRGLVAQASISQGGITGSFASRLTGPHVRLRLNKELSLTPALISLAHTLISSLCLRKHTRYWRLDNEGVCWYRIRDGKDERHDWHRGRAASRRKGLPTPYFVLAEL
ncbi:hypothetical protein EI94DRAFT_1791169 [Lactarius quietus]|nr:hypothetical protein EI94DRAFT_1791169 [Lactarius quietus]